VWVISPQEKQVYVYHSPTDLDIVTAEQTLEAGDLLPGFRLPLAELFRQGIGEFKHGRDELYQNSLITRGSEVLVTAYSEPSKDPKNTGKHEPMVWVATYGKGRVCNNALGHDVEAMQSDGFKTLLIRGVEWAATGRTFTAAPAGIKARE
jgi:type 1 glutamine amidotransferase